MSQGKILRLPRNKKKRQIYFIVAGSLLGLLILAILTPSQPGPNLNPTLTAQTKQHQELIASWAPNARQMQKKYGILASISLAQAILESNWNQSELAQKYHNLYGVKAHGNQASILIETSEYENGHWLVIKDNFAVYPNWQASMEDHARLLKEGTPWNALQYQHVMAAKDYKKAAQAMVADGYATDPAYAQKLINIIETWHLQRFDLPT